VKGESMTLDKAIAYFKRHIDLYCVTGICREAEEMAIQALEQTQWIPVSERLPEEGVDVLACFYTGEGNYKMMVSRRSDHNYWNGVGRTSDMVAWMPLPEPYREVEK
jgi:hypothetical protein